VFSVCIANAGVMAIGSVCIADKGLSGALFLCTANKGVMEIVDGQYLGVESIGARKAGVVRTLCGYC
jgi:hypothetical protein